MEVIHFAETNMAINQYLSELRDVNIHTDRDKFRRILRRIGNLIA